MGKTVVAKVMVHNMPEHGVIGYVVARAVDAKLWYYGLYDTSKRAHEVAEKLGNGLVLEAI